MEPEVLERWRPWPLPAFTPSISGLVSRWFVVTDLTESLTGTVVLQELVAEVMLDQVRSEARGHVWSIAALFTWHVESADTLLPA